MSGHKEQVNSYALRKEFSSEGADEAFFAISAGQEDDFLKAALHLMKLYEAKISESGCSLKSEVFLRFYLSDVERQAPVMRGLLGERCSFISFVGQPPADGSRLCLEAYHIKTSGFISKSLAVEANSSFLDVAMDNYSFLYHRGRAPAEGNISAQTQLECRALNLSLRSRGVRFNNCLRTCFYLKDIDRDYKAFAEARRSYYKTIGLTEDTAFVSSTGIGGQNEDPGRLLTMDSVSVIGTENGQIENMSALENMPPTHIYGVTFERGTRVIYGDRSHYYISGTASIDVDGNIMHVGDVEKQTRRALENVDALLRNHSGTLADLSLATVYLRYSRDYGSVSAVLSDILPPEVPLLIVEGSVCRPDWLIEIDGMAVNKNGNSHFRRFA